VPESDARFAKIIRGHLHVDLVADADADEILPHLAGDMSQHLVTIGERHPEHRAGQHLRHGANEFYGFFFWHRLDI